MVQYLFRNITGKINYVNCDVRSGMVEKLLPYKDQERPNMVYETKIFKIKSIRFFLQNCCRSGKMLEK